MKKIAYLLILLIISLKGYAQGIVDVDTTFNTEDVGFWSGDGFGRQVFSILIQDDGKLVITGAFENYNSSYNNRIIRLNTDGTIDKSFVVGTGTNNSILSAVMQPDGKIILAGEFTSYNGTSANYITRLNADGTKDKTFAIGSGADNIIKKVILQSDGKIIIQGNFFFYNGFKRHFLARLNSDGSVDTAFDVANDDYYISTVGLQKNGQLITNGFLTSDPQKNKMARLHTTGKIDNTFKHNTDNTIATIDIQEDDKIIITGSFKHYDQYAKTGIARLLANGEIDSTFTNDIQITSLTAKVNIQNDGKLILSNDSIFNIDTLVIPRVVRLNSDGSLDDTFHTGSGVDYSISATVNQKDGKTIIGGTFTRYNGVTVRRIARLNTDGTLDLTFNKQTGANHYVRDILLQPDKKLIVSGDFTSFNSKTLGGIIRLNEDGSIDKSFDSGLGASTPGDFYLVEGTALQPDGKILACGYFNAFNGIKKSGIIRLLSNGQVDTTFTNPKLNYTHQFTKVIVLPNKKILIGGGHTSRYFDIFRLKENGTVDSTFLIRKNAEDGWIRDMHVFNDGKIMIAGGFMQYNGTRQLYVARLNENGTLDKTFTSTLDLKTNIVKMAVQKDGKILICGTFSYGTPEETCIKRLNTNGTLDTTFKTIGFKGNPTSVFIQENGKIILGGSYFPPKSGETETTNFIRLNHDGTFDLTFPIGKAGEDVIWKIALDANDQFLLGGSFYQYNQVARNRIVRLSFSPLVGIEEGYTKQQPSILVYPNPMDQSSTLTLAVDNLKATKANITIMDLLGKQIVNERITPVSNTLRRQFRFENALSKGVYIIAIVTEETVMTERLVIQ